MARFLDDDEVSARERLAAAGVRIVRADDPDLADLQRALLGEATFERGRTTAEPPPDEAAAVAGLGAWHVNAVNEAHSVLDGTGVAQFMTPTGAVTVVLEGGDVMCVEQAEHRYRALTPQRWILRHGGPADLALTPTFTDRQSGPWTLP